MNSAKKIMKNGGENATQSTVKQSRGLSKNMILILVGIILVAVLGGGVCYVNLRPRAILTVEGKDADGKTVTHTINYPEAMYDIYQAEAMASMYQMYGMSFDWSDTTEDGDRAQHGAQRKHVGKVESAGVKTGGGHDLRHLIEHADHVQQQPQQRHRDDLDDASRDGKHERHLGRGPCVDAGQGQAHAAGARRATTRFFTNLHTAGRGGHVLMRLRLFRTAQRLAGCGTGHAWGLRPCLRLMAFIVLAHRCSLQNLAYF